MGYKKRLKKSRIVTVKSLYPALIVLLFNLKPCANMQQVLFVKEVEIMPRAMNQQVLIELLIQLLLAVMASIIANAVTIPLF